MAKLVLTVYSNLIVSKLQFSPNGYTNKTLTFIYDNELLHQFFLHVLVGVLKTSSGVVGYEKLTYLSPNVTSQLYGLFDYPRLSDCKFIMLTNDVTSLTSITLFNEDSNCYHKCNGIVNPTHVKQTLLEHRYTIDIDTKNIDIDKVVEFIGSEKLAEQIDVKESKNGYHIRLIKPKCSLTKFRVWCLNQDWIDKRHTSINYTNDYDNEIPILFNERIRYADGLVDYGKEEGVKGELKSIWDKEWFITYVDKTSYQKVLKLLSTFRYQHDLLTWTINIFYGVKPDDVIVYNHQNRLLATPNPDIAQLIQTTLL